MIPTGSTLGHKAAVEVDIVSRIFGFLSDGGYAPKENS